MSDKDTIAAISTAHGKSAIGVIRVSGQNVQSIINEFVGRKLKPRFATNVEIRDKKNISIDDVIVIYFKAPSLSIKAMPPGAHLPSLSVSLTRLQGSPTFATLPLISTG